MDRLLLPLLAGGAARRVPADLHARLRNDGRRGIAGDGLQLRLAHAAIGGIGIGDELDRDPKRIRRTGGANP